MEPAVTRSIGQGFSAANKSWTGIACYAGGWIALALFVILSVVMTNPPPEVFQEPQAAERKPANVPDTAPPVPTETDTAEPVTVFDQMETVLQPPARPEASPAGTPSDTTATDADSTQAASAPEASAEASSAQNEQRRVVIRQWFSRAWPLLLFSLLLFIAASSLLYAGQIGYLAKRVITQQASAKDFWVEGSRAFLPLVGGSVLALAGLSGFALAFALLAALLSALPQAAGAVLGLVLMTAIMAALMWLLIRLSFWFVVIVVERQGPLAALKASFRVTKGRWWKLAALGCLMAVISYGATLIFLLVQWIGGVIGGPAAAVLGVLGQVAAAVAGVYVSFAALGAYIRFYTDAKSGSGPSVA